MTMINQYISDDLIAIVVDFWVGTYIKNSSMSRQQIEMLYIPFNSADKRDKLQNCSLS